MMRFLSDDLVPNSRRTRLRIELAGGVQRLGGDFSLQQRVEAGMPSRYTTFMSAEPTVDRLTEVLTGEPGVVSAYLFGSVAEGRAHRESDVDVAILLDWAAYPTRRDRFERRLALLFTLARAAGRTVDLVILNEAPPQLARRIMTAGTRLLARDEERDHAHLRLVLSRAADLEPFLRRARTVKLQAMTS